MKSFYVELLSSASSHIYPSNKNNCWTNHFAQPIALEGHYEVALTEISLVPNVINVNFEGKLEIFDFLEQHSDGTYGKYYEDIAIKAGCYATSQEFADELNRVIGKTCPRLAGKKIFNYSKITQKFFVDISDDLFCTIFIYGRLLLF